MTTSDAPVADPSEQDEEKPLKLKVEIEELDNWKRKLSIEIEQEDVTERYEDLLKELGGSARLDGFRQGRVPRQILLNKFGKELDEDVKKQLIGDSFRQATEDNKLKVVSEPEWKLDEIEFKAEKPLAYEATVEIEPEFELPEYKGVKIEAASTEVTDEDVSKEIDVYRDRAAAFEPAPDDAEIEDRDTVTIDAAVKVGGDVAWREEEHLVGVHEKHVHGFPFEVEAETLLGGKIGEQKTATVTLLEDFDKKEFAGKEGEMSLKILDIKRRVLPELDEEFVKGIGADSLDDLQTRVREEIETARVEQGKAKLRSDLIDALIEAAPFDLPEGMVKRQAAMSRVEQQLQMIRLGISPAKVAELFDGEEWKEKDREAVVSQIKMRLILDRIADAEEMKVEDGEVHEEIARIAADSGRPMGVVHREMAESGRLEEIRESVRRRKVLDFLVEQADIKEASKGSGK